MQEHKRNPEKDYWTEAIVFTTTNNSFGPTEISYLENRFCNLAMEAKRYEVKNGNDPTPGNVTEEKESELEEFIDYARIIMGTLGHKVFVPLIESKVEDTKSDSDSIEIILQLKRTIKGVGTIEATGKQTSEGFVVLKGTHISPNDDNTIPAILREQRKGTALDDNGCLMEDILFNSPSYAAMFVFGKSANGLTSWKTEDGRTLKEIEAE